MTRISMADKGETTTDAEAKLEALLGDLNQLSNYLTERGQHTYELAQRFLENATRNASSRAYDERQAAMLGYQHYIWFQMAGLVDKLLVAYGGEPASAESGDTDQPPTQKD
ncbi:MAG: hypothetical protein ACLQUY_18695 [Ktedonobacterales bacterium]